MLKRAGICIIVIEYRRYVVHKKDVWSPDSIISFTDDCRRSPNNVHSRFCYRYLPTITNRTKENKTEGKLICCMSDNLQM